jgi:hypothetical protein
MSDYLFTVSPFLEYKNYFNVFIIKVPSVQSGVTHPATANDEANPISPPVSNINNFYGSTFDYSSIHRLLFPTNLANINAVVANNFPLYDHILVVANSPEYGGSGGTFATSSIHSESNEVAVHELGHSFGGLADEYSNSGGGRKPNKTDVTDPNTIKWKRWLNINNIGIYPIGDGFQRPHQLCKMRLLGHPFCSVCTETIVEKIHTISGPIRSFSPANTSSILVGFPTTTFTLDLIKPNPNTLGVTWKLNDIIVGTNESLILNNYFLQNSSNTLIAYIVDTTTLSKSETHTSLHTSQLSWTIASPCSNTATLVSPNNDILSLITSNKNAEQSIQANNKISVIGSNITYQAGNTISLNQGFEARSGSIFEAKIGGCKDSSSIGLVAYYPFNGNADDETGYGNNGVVNGATLTTDRFGKADKAYAFDGIDDMIRVTQNANLNAITKTTISFWANHNQVTRTTDGFDWQAYISKDTFGKWFSSMLCTNPAGCGGEQPLTFYTPGLSKTDTRYNWSTVSPNVWCYITLSNDGTTSKIYVNGIIVKSENVTGSITTNISDLILGRCLTGSLYPLDGKLDDVRIYNRALSDAEVTALYNAEKP